MSEYVLRLVDVIASKRCFVPILHVVIIARRENNLSDAVEVKIAGTGEAAKISATLKERFQGEAKVAPQVTAASAAEIEKLQLPDGARKRRYFVDLRD